MARNVIPAAAGEGRESLYERDYYTWTVEQARALKDHHVANLDWKNLAEEVEDLGKSERREFQNRLEVLLAHLLKWQFQPKRRSRSWNATMAVKRVKIRELLDENPGLKPSIPAPLARAYQPARIEVASRLPASSLSEPSQACPWSFEQVMDDSFRPSSALYEARKITRQSW